MLVNIQDEIAKLNKLGLLKDLLKDKTTNANILWATDAYRELGSEYDRSAQIFPEQITGKNAWVIKNRACKELEQQNERTKQHAEVFTPSWVCNKMNNYIDEERFGKKDVFNKDGVPTENIEFPSNKTWQGYVDSTVLEITCGEAPFLVSRYDMATGEEIELEKRIGLLDRKIRVINENTDNITEWLEWVIRAYKATYGYEFQGDNLLIARVNMLMTFEEYLFARWNMHLEDLTSNETKELINIIVWNIWQMDGLTGTIPYSDIQEKQTALAEVFVGSVAIEKPPCKIYDWQEKHSVEYLSMQNND